MNRRQLDLESLRQLAGSRRAVWDEIDLESPIDNRRPFLCETVTPLYYTEVYSQLGPEHRRRYNQLTGMSFNEVISFFEQHFAQQILAALIARRRRLPRALVEAMTRFAEEETQHTEAFRALNRLSDPRAYADRDHFILRTPSAVLRLVHSFTGRPELFPAVIWIALVMEEKSLATSRALIRAGESIEPHYLAVYRAHLQDEIRHVNIDWHMLDHLYAERSFPLRWANARLFCFVLTRLFLAPAHAGRRVVEILLAEHPELEPLGPRIFSQLEALARAPSYHRMMYSREVTPIAFDLFDRFSEFRSLGKRLFSYSPPNSGASR